MDHPLEERCVRTRARTLSVNCLILFLQQHDRDAVHHGSGSLAFGHSLRHWCALFSCLLFDSVPVRVLLTLLLWRADISEQCGYSIKQQVDLFISLKPLFANKPVIVACNKTDVVKLDDI